MAARSNAIEELTRFWLQEFKGCLVREAVPVKVKYNLSDIDIVAIQSALMEICLPNKRYMALA